MKGNPFVRWIATGVLVLIAVGLIYVRYQAYFRNPWTRDGLVQAEVVGVASRVTAPIRALHVVDNQEVHAGELLFELEDSTYQVALKQAEATLAQRQALLRQAEDVARRENRLSRLDAGAVAQEAVQKANDQLMAARAEVDIAQAMLEEARLNLAFTKIYAPVDGFITNLTLQPGTMAVADTPLVALINKNSFWIEAFFRETIIAGFKPGDKALVTLMSYSDDPIQGVVSSIGWGIARQNGETGEKLLPSVSPTFEWIRLAQRIPVRVHLHDVPASVKLRMGTTASVLVRLDPQDQKGDILPVPFFLQ